ncbi:MAG: hypothetical protein M3Y48_13280 [Actinomycetota bacterium]|nr:hypothetical protein [Actinomycetota bacterium]
MAHKRAGLLAQIEVGVLDDSVLLSSLLQKCIVLGGKAGSAKMRDWARQELNGYQDVQNIPDYRRSSSADHDRLRAQVKVVITNLAGYNPITRSLSASDLGDQLCKILADSKVELEVVPLGANIGQLEALASSNEDEHKLVPYWADAMLQTLNDHCIDSTTSRAVSIYWSVSRASFQGLMVRVRTALSELVAELIALTPEDQEVPDKLAADQATQFVITGNRPTINYSLQHATHGGTNVAVAPPVSGPVIVSGGQGTAIGSQTASGVNSSVVGSQTVQGDHNAIAGRDVANTGTKEQPAKEGWWARLRKRGMVVAFATIIGGIATVAGTGVAVFTWIGWTPWN